MRSEFVYRLCYYHLFNSNSYPRLNTVLLSLLIWLQTFNTSTTMLKQLTEQLKDLAGACSARNVDLQQPFAFSQQRQQLKPQMKYANAVLQLSVLNNVRQQGGAYLATLAAHDVVTKACDPQFVAHLEAQVAKMEEQLNITAAVKATPEFAAEFEVRARVMSLSHLSLTSCKLCTRNCTRSVDCVQSVHPNARRCIFNHV